MEMPAVPPLPQAPKMGDFGDQYPPEAAASPAAPALLMALMPSIGTQGEDLSAAARSGQPPTPGRGTSASALSPRSKGYAGGVTKSGKRRRRHPVAEIKGGWSFEEDARLKQLVETYGEGSWSKLVPYFSGRIGKQLRERWNHELRPDIQKGAWTEEEERALVEQHRVHKNAWADIARALPGRTCNAVKNHWNATLRRVNRGGQRTLQSPVEVYMDELGLIDAKNKNRPLHRTHNFHSNSRLHGGAGQGSSMRWLPELPPAMKVSSAALDPSAASQPLVSRPLSADAPSSSGPPSTPNMALSTPAMSAPTAVLPAASTALSANDPQPGIQLDINQIAKKWGHPSANGMTNSAEPKQVETENMQNGMNGAPDDAPATDPPLQEPSPAKDDKEAEEEPAGAAPTEGLRSKSPAAANHDKAASKSAHSAEEETDTDDSDVDIETIEDSGDNGRQGGRRAATSSRGQSTDADAEEATLRRSKRQRVSPQDNAFHFFNRDDAEKEAPRKPHLEEAAMALLLLDVHSAPGKGADEVDGLPRSARGRRLRPAQRTGNASSDDDDPLSPSVALPRNARKRRTGWEESLRRPNTPARHPSSADATPKEHPPRLRQVADMATQTAPLPQMLARTGSGAEGKEAQTALYGVNAVMANSSRAANGKTAGYASTVNVRDKLAGFIVSLASASDRWDRDASPALVRCRNGLGRSSDPKVVALRQAVLDKCMAFRGPPPTQAVAAMAALLAEMAPIVAAAHESATVEEAGQGKYAGPGSIVGSASSRPVVPPSRPVQRATTHHFKSNPPLASVAPPALQPAPPRPSQPASPNLSRAQMEAAMRALSSFQGLPLRPEMLAMAMARQNSPRQVTTPHPNPSPHALLQGSPHASAGPLTALIQPGVSSDKVGTPSAGTPPANPTLAAAMAGMPLAQMLHMGPGMAGRPAGPVGPPGPGPSRLGSGLPASPASVSLPSSTEALSLPGSGLTVRTKMGPAAQPQVASPVVPVSTPNQALGYGPMPSAPLSAASRTPLHMQSFLAALQQPEPVPQPAVPPVSQPAPLPGQASHQVTTGAIAPRHSQVTTEAPAALQPNAPVAQASEQTAAPGSGAPAVL